MNEYINALTKEISLFKNIYSLKPKTIYFGGGTPSLLNKNEIQEVLSCFDLSHLEECTLEANPHNINAKFAEEVIESGVDRISMGAQSFLDKELKLLGRLHNRNKIMEAWIVLKQTGFTNLSLDLIYGLPSQNIKDLEYSIDEILKLSPEHISIYCLSLEKKVPMYELRKGIPDDEQVADFYHYIRERLINSGYDQYEISNFSRPGFQSRHNLSYWNDKFYLGLGPSASGYVYKTEPGNEFVRIRYTNEADLYLYYKGLEDNKILQDKQILTAGDHEKEFIFLNLRKTEGYQIAVERFPE